MSGKAILVKKLFKLEEGSALTASVFVLETALSTILLMYSPKSLLYITRKYNICIYTMCTGHHMHDGDSSLDCILTCVLSV